MYKKESDSLGTLIELCSNKNVAVSFSCGKDSLVVLDLASRIGIEKAVFADTSIEFKETLEYLEYIQDFYNIDVVRSSKDFFSYVKDLGLPSRRYRWCCDVLKFGPLANYAIENKIAAFITGLRRDESRRRECYDILNFNPAIPVPQVNPILDWSDEDIWNYIKEHNLPYNPLYKHFSRVGCFCCPYRSNKDEWKKVRELFPEGMDKLDRTISEKTINVKSGYKQLFKEDGWKSWTYPLKKINVGKYSFDESSNSFKIRINDLNQVEKVKNLIDILDNEYEISNNDFTIFIDENKKGEEFQKIKVMIEKSINCIQCSTCLALCEKGALYVNGNIKVNSELCEKCSECLIANGNTSLRMMCIARNYTRNRNTLIQVNS